MLKGLTQPGGRAEASAKVAHNNTPPAAAAAAAAAMKRRKREGGGGRGGGGEGDSKEAVVRRAREARDALNARRAKAKGKGKGGSSIGGSYGLHVSFIRALREAIPAGEEEFSFEDLRGAREEFSALHPLPASMWAEWIDDEAAAGAPAASLVPVFQRAFADWQCADLWPRYLKILEELCDDGTLGDDMLRGVYELALTKVGAHMSVGPLVWALYRSFIEDELQDLQETGAGDDEVQKTGQLLLKLYRRQLSLPLPGNDGVLARLGEVFGEAELKRATPVFESSKAMLQERLPLEESLVGLQPSGSDTLPAEWASYIDFEAEQGQPARAQLLCERALSEGWGTCEPLWLRYSHLLARTLASHAENAAVMRRATRSIPHSCQLWLRLMLAEERVGGDVSSTSELALRSLKMRKDQLRICLARCDAARRAAYASLGSETSSAERESRLNELRTAFDSAETQAGQDDEAWAACLQYRALTEETVARLARREEAEAVARAEEVWERLVKRCGKQARSWLDYIRWRQSLPLDSLDNCRSLFRRALNLVRDDPEMLLQAYTSFESQRGGLDDLEEAQIKVDRRRMTLNASAAPIPSPAVPRPPSKAIPKRALAAVEGEAASAAAVPPNPKRRRLAADSPPPAATPLSHTIVITNLPFTATEEEIKAALTASIGPVLSVNLLLARSGRSRGMCEVELESPEAAARATAAGEAGELSVGGRQVKILVDDEKAKAVRPVQPYHDFTVFVSGIPCEVSADELSSVLGACGGVEFTQILMEKDTGTSKGLALVQFRESASVDKALALHDPQISGKKLKISRSTRPAINEIAREKEGQPTGGQVAPALPGPAEHKFHDTTVFVSGLPDEVTDAELSHVFEDCGPIQHCHVVVDRRTGASKGIGLVQFELASAVPVALSLAAQLHGKQLKVERSKFPAVSTQTQSGPAYHETTVFVSGIPEEVDDATLCQLLQPCGTIKLGRVVREKSTGHSRGTGFVEFESANAVDAALALAVQVGSKKLRIERSRFPADPAAQTEQKHQRQLQQPKRKLLIPPRVLKMHHQEASQGTTATGEEMQGQEEAPGQSLTNADFKAFLK